MKTTTPKNSNESKILQKIAGEYSSIGDDVIVARLNQQQNSEIQKPRKAIKIEGMTIIVNLKGRMTLEINTEKFESESSSITLLSPGTLLSLQSAQWDLVDTYVVYFSPEFLQEINISFSSISGEVMIEPRSPVLSLANDELDQVMRYVKLFQTVTYDDYNQTLRRHIVASLASALFYQILLIVYKRLDIVKDADIDAKIRRSSYVREFIKLVHKHFTQERSINFYASKLCITPKYLSMLVREATEQTAACWIHRFVIMEAKILLKYSGKNIQQIAYALNFSNQSSFGKYFKHFVGMSPTEFQKQ